MTFIADNKENRYSLTTTYLYRYDEQIEIPVVREQHSLNNFHASRNNNNMIKQMTNRTTAITMTYAEKWLVRGRNSIAKRYFTSSLPLPLS